MLVSKWLFVLITSLLTGLAVSVYLACHHYRVNILRPSTKSFCVRSKVIDCDRVASGVGSTLAGIPVATLGMFAHFFLLFLILSEHFLKLEIQKVLYCAMYPILLAMVLFSAYEAFISFVVLRAICIMCAVLYVTMALMLVSCRRALAMSSREIFAALHDLFHPCVSESAVWKGLTAAVVAVGFSSIGAFGLDHGFRTHFRKKADQQAAEQRVTEQAAKSAPEMGFAE